MYLLRGMDAIPTLILVVVRDDMLQGSLVHENIKPWRRWLRLDASLPIDPRQVAHNACRHANCPRERGENSPAKEFQIGFPRPEKLVGVRLTVARKSRRWRLARMCGHLECARGACLRHGLPQVAMLMHISLRCSSFLFEGRNEGCTA